LEGTESLKAKKNQRREGSFENDERSDGEERMRKRRRTWQ